MLEYLIFVNTAKGWLCGWIMHFVLPLPLAHIPPYEALISLPLLLRSSYHIVFRAFPLSSLQSFGQQRGP